MKCALLLNQKRRLFRLHYVTEHIDTLMLATRVHMTGVWKQDVSLSPPPHPIPMCLILTLVRYWLDVILLMKSLFDIYIYVLFGA